MAAGSTSTERSSRAGIGYALAAYTWWGFAPLYFKLVSATPAPAVLAHRIVWSALFIACLIGVTRRWPVLLGTLRSPRVLGWLAVCTALLSVNWLIFIHAIATDRLVECSLGYFVNPLLTVVLGVFFLGERLRARQWAAVAIACAAIVYLSATSGGLPWIALALPLTFGFYSLIRKRLSVDPLSGLFVETALVTPIAVAWLSWFHGREGSAADGSPATIGVLALSGVVTATPMLWFVAAAKRLPLATIGFLQYLNPTLQFLTAVLVFGEPLDTDRLYAFVLTWIAVGIFIADVAVQARSTAAPGRSIKE